MTQNPFVVARDVRYHSISRMFAVDFHSKETLPCIAGAVPVKMLLCRHYPVLKGLSFVVVSQELDVSQTDKTKI